MKNREYRSHWLFGALLQGSCEEIVPMVSGFIIHSFRTKYHGVLAQ